MAHGPGHRLSSCSKFKALSLQERRNELQKHGLGLSSFSPQHWLSSSSNQKQWGVNGSLRSHNALLHNLRDATLAKISDVVSSTNPAVQTAVGSSTKQSSLSHKSSNTSVLLQVVPVTLYSSKVYFSTHGMLDAGSTWNLLLAEASEKLGLDGPLESVLMNGIQKTSEQPSKHVNLQVSPLNDFGTQFHINEVLVVDYMNVPEKKVRLQKLKEKWPHLSDVELTEVEGTQFA